MQYSNGFSELQTASLSNKSISSFVYTATLQELHTLTRNPQPTSLSATPSTIPSLTSTPQSRPASAAFSHVSIDSPQRAAQIRQQDEQQDAITGLSDQGALVSAASFGLPIGLPGSGLPNFIVRVPDLVMREGSIGQIGDGVTTVSWRVENTTDPTLSRGAAITSAWADRLYLSSDTVVSADDLVLATPQGLNRFENQPPLAAGASYTRQAQISLNLPTAAAGSRPYLLVTTNAIIEGLARPREYDDGQGSGELQLGTNNTIAIDLRTIPIPDAPNRNAYNFLPNGCGEVATAPLTSDVELHSGAVIETHNLVSYQSQGINRGIILRYNSLHADPRHIVHFGYRNVLDQPGEQLLVARLAVQRGNFFYQLPGYSGNLEGMKGGEHFWAIPDQNSSKQIQSALQFDLRNQGSGVYEYVLERGIYTLPESASQPAFSIQASVPELPASNPLKQIDLGTVANVNRRNSVFGHGWSLVGWQELVINPNNSVLLIDGDGTLRIFKPPTTTGGAYISPTGDQSRLERLSDGTFRRTLKDQTVYRFNVRNQLAEIRDRNGNTTRYIYNTAGQLQQVIDPVGLITTFTYTGNRVTRITDPMGRVTQLAYDAAGNLQRVTDPDGSSRTWNYDAQSRMTVERDQRGNQEEVIYDFAGRADRARRKDNSVINVDPAQGKGLYTPTRTIDPFQAPTVFTPTAASALNPQAVYTDGRGNVTRTGLNQSGNVISRSDAIGNLESFTRCGCGRIDALTDGRGNTTRFTYDAWGNVTTVQDSLSGTRPKTFTYDARFNQLTSITDELGRQTLFQLDERGNVITRQDVIGAVGGGDDRITRFTYLANGLVDTITDPLGRITDFDYDARGRLITTTFAKGTAVQGIERYEYDNAGNRTAKIDARGNRTSYRYDSHNRLIEITAADPDGAGPLTAPVTRYSYDAAGNLSSVQNARNHVTRYGYDAMNRISQVTAADPDGVGPLTAPVTRYTYNANGNVTQTIDALGRVTQFSYDARNRLTSIIRPDPDGTGPLASPVTRFTYDLANNLTSIINPLNNQTFYGYDARNRLISKTTPDPDGTTGQQVASVTRYSYDAANQLTLITHPNAQITRYGYNALGQLISITEPDPDGAGALTSPITQYRYDLIGNLTAVIDPLNRTTSYQYDARNRLIRHTSPDPDGTGPAVASFTGYSYDAVGNLTTVGDALGQTTRYGYDALNRRVSVTDSLNQITRYEYDANGNLTAVVDPLNNRTRYSYDALDRLTQETNALNLSRTYRYDAVDNLLGITDRNGRQRSFVYDRLDRRIGENWLDTSGTTIRSFTFQYDANERLTAAFDPVSRYSYSYDAMDRLTRVDNNGTPNMPRVTFDYTYDRMSNLLSSADSINGSAQGRTDYAYDLLNRVTRIIQSGTGVAAKRVDMTYNAAGQITQLARFSDLAGTQAVAATTYTYDSLGRLTQMAHNRGATNLATYGIGYDAANRITRFTSPQGTTNYSYDARNQVRFADHSYQTDESYSYDANGNRTNSGYQTGPNNRLTNDGSFTYQYDNEGNRIRRIRISNGEVTEYTWDYRNRLTQVITRASAGGAITRQVNYTYDVHDQRIAKTVDLDGAGAGAATIERFVYDRGQIALVFNGSSTTPAQRYLYGTEVDQVLAEQRGTTTTWALTDHQGTVRDLIDNTGANRNRIRYDSFGNITNQTNPALTFRFGYTGRDFDSETGLSYYRARYYDARVGRFLSEDPIGFGGGDANLYRYVGNSPANYTDPTGLAAETVLDVAMVGYDLYRIYNDNIANNCGNLGENLTSLGLNLVSAALPFVPALGAIGRGADDAADALRNLENAANAGETGIRGGGRTGEAFYASTPVGRRGNHIQVPPPANRRMTIGGREYSGHSLDRMQEQGIVPSVVENAIQYGQKIPGRRPGAEVYYDSVNDVTVVLDTASGRVITADLGKFKGTP